MSDENQWTLCPNLRSPNRKSPTKALSRKKAKAPSIARVWAMMSPVKAENAAQLVPNWNSIGMPVTTPKTKVTAKILPQNRAPLL
jgi:hypothetical protein